MSSKLRSDAPLWQLGFRPFFLVAALFAAVSIGLWLAFLFGALPYSGFLSPVIWHSHEMVFGFASAVIAGFVMTAVQNWTGIRGVHGGKLQAIFALWVAARILLLAPPPLKVLAAVADLSFYPLLALYLIPYLRDSEMRVERVFFAYFALYFTGNLLVHLESFGLVSGYSQQGILLGLYTTVIMVIFMGGRVIPFFTESSIAKAQPKTWNTIEVLSHVTAWVFLATQIFMRESPLSAAVAFSTASIHLIRLSGWYVRRIRRVPVIWVLHVAYLWIVVGFALSGFVSLGMVASTIAVHAYTVGALGTVIYGMISRVSLGHTGRPLRPQTSVVVGYYLLTAAALVRVLVVLIDSALHDGAVIASGLLWMSAFAIFLAAYFPVLTSRRADGRNC